MLKFENITLSDKDIVTIDGHEMTVKQLRSAVSSYSRQLERNRNHKRNKVAKRERVSINQ